MTFQSPSHLKKRLKALSETNGKTEQQMLEDILLQALPEIAETQTNNKHSWIGMASSDITDLSERVDELLFADGSLERQQGYTA